jgi:hypothetical protein
MLKERDVWTSLKKSAQLPFAVRVESPTSPGIPDVFFSLGGVTGWMELKFVRTAKPLVRSTLRPLQFRWAKEASAAGVFTTVLLFWRDQAILLAGADVEALVEADAETVQRNALWVGGTDPQTRWAGIQEKLEQHGRQFQTLCVANSRAPIRR